MVLRHLNPALVAQTFGKQPSRKRLKGAETRQSIIQREFVHDKLNGNKQYQ